jgi:hypothetical protein
MAVWINLKFPLPVWSWPGAEEGLRPGQKISLHMLLFTRRPFRMDYRSGKGPIILPGGFTGLGRER